jgi:hypothetical protein
MSNPTFIWQVESLRFTLFYQIGKQPTNNLLKEITNGEPHNKIQRPLEGLTVEEGIWNDNSLSVSFRPDRIDIILTPQPAMIPILPSLGLLDEVIEKISNILDKLSFDNIIRIAFGLVLQHPENDHVSAYQSLATLLTNVKIDSASSDFLYQINNPIESKNNSSVRINRLQRWSVSRIEIFTFDNSNNTELFATRLELDINTHPTNSLVALENVRDLMNELIQEASVIAKG